MTEHTKILSDFINYLSSQGFSASTIQSYSINLNEFLEFLANNKLEIKQITDHQILTYTRLIKQNGNRPQTINCKLYSIKKFITFLKEIKFIKSNCDIKFKKLDIRKKDIVYIDNINKLFDSVVTSNGKWNILERDLLLLKMLYYTGAKTKEILNIQVKDFKNNLVIAEKEIIVNINLRKDIKKYILSMKLKPNDYFFPNFKPSSTQFKSDSPIVEKTAQDIFNKYKGAIDNKLSIIDLRNSYVVSLKNIYSNLNIDIIKSHKSINFNGDYLRLIKYHKIHNGKRLKE